MKLLSKIYVIVILALIISSCHKDQDDKSVITKDSPNVVIFEQINGNVFGNVKDENNQPINNAIVTIYSSTAQTDENGVFSFKNIKLDKQGTYIMVEKSGYITASDVVYPQEGHTSHSYITMFRLDNSDFFNSNEGGEISSDGVKVSFSPNSIVKPDGTDHKGRVYVFSKILKVKDKNFGDMMPGALRGEDKTGKTVVLGTAGMILVELRDNTGAELNIKKGKSAKMEFEIEEADIAHLPKEMPLWYFDENKGLWIEEGKAQLKNGKYVGELPHFSWWNLDFPFDPIYMCSTVKYDNGKPAQNLIIQLEADIVYPVSYGWTGNEGKVCGLVPKDQEMVLSVLDPFCHEVLYTTTIGPFGEDVTLDDIILTYDTKFGEGKVVCNGVAESNAIVIIKKDWGDIPIAVDETGGFDLNQFISKCDSSLIGEFKIFAYNPETNQASSEVTLNADGNGGENIVLNLCSDCDFKVDIEAEYGTECDPSSIKSLTAKISESGTYEYLWSNGATEQTITNLGNGLYCVTVTETTTDCEVTKCIEVNYNASVLSLKGLFVINPFCGHDNGHVFALSDIGGMPPYKISVTGPNGFTSNSLQLKGLAPGVYTFTVEDGLGCTATRKIELQDESIEVYFEQYPDFKNPDSVVVFAYLNPIDSLSLLEYDNRSYVWSTGQTGNLIKVGESGTYCVTVTISDYTNCEFTGCIDVEVDTTTATDEVPEITGCEGNIQYIDFPKECKIITETGNTYLTDSLTEINVLIDGYSFGVIYPYYPDRPLITIYIPSIMYPNSSQDRAIVIDDVVNTGCETCNDGKINYHFDNSIGSYILESEFGHIAIYAEDDLGTDLSETNDKGELNSGTYYIVVHDKNTDCYIAHEKVVVQ